MWTRWQLLERLNDLNDNITVDDSVDLSTNVASITLAANSVIDVAAGGADQAITLADVTGDFDLTLTGDSASAVGLNAVDVDALAVTGTLTLNDNITVDDSVDLSTNVASITLAANSVIDVAAGGADQAITLADTTGNFDLTLTGDSASALGVDGADVNALTLTGGVLTLNGDVESDGALDFTNVGSITLGGNVIVTSQNSDSSNAAGNITFDSANIITGASTLALDGDTVTLYQVGNGATDPTQLTVTADTSLSLNADLTVDGAVDLSTNVASITLAANSAIDSSGGTNAAISLAGTTGDFDLTLTGDSASAVGLNAVDVDALAVTGTLTLNDNITVDDSVDLSTNVASITLAANSVIDVAAGGADQAITLADVTGDFDLTLTGDSASAVGLNAVDVDALAVTGTLTLNDNITVDDSVDLSTNVASITLAANSVIDVAAGGADQAITLADVTGDFDLTLTGDSASAVGLNAVDVDALAVTGTLTLNDNITVDDSVDLSTNVASITLAANSVIDVAADRCRGADQAITLADVTGDFDLTLTGDSASAVGLNAVDVDALAVTGTLTLNDNITVDDSVDLSTNVASITLAANSVIDVAAGGADQAITLADVTGDFDLTLTGDSASAVGLNAVDVDALAVTGTLTLNDNITVDDSVDLSTNVASITLAANSVIDVAA